MTFQSPTLTVLADGCLAQEFQEHIEQAVFSLVASTPTTQQYNYALLLLQRLYHTYRKENPCRASAFAAVHRCIFDVYCDAYERLMKIQPVEPPPPASTSRRERRKKQPVPVDYAEYVAKLQEAITGVPVGKVVDDDPFK